MKFKLAIELELTSSMGGWVDVVVDGWWILLNYGLTQVKFKLQLHLGFKKLNKDCYFL